MANLDLTTSGEENQEQKEVSIQFSEEEKKQIEQYKDNINLNSTTDIIQFGKEYLQEIKDEALFATRQR